MQGRAVAGGGPASPGVPFTCGNPGPMWPDIARRLALLAPNLAPRKLVSSANIRQAEQAAGPPPPKQAAIIFPGHLCGAAGPASARLREPGNTLDGPTNIAAANRHHARDPWRTLKLLQTA